MRITFVFIALLFTLNQGSQASDDYSPLYKSVTELSADMELLACL